MVNIVDVDQTAENGKQYRPWSDWEWQIVQTLIRLLIMAYSVVPDQTVPGNDSAYIDLDQTAEK